MEIFLYYLIYVGLIANIAFGAMLLAAGATEFFRDQVRPISDRKHAISRILAGLADIFIAIAFLYFLSLDPTALYLIAAAQIALSQWSWYIRTYYTDKEDV